MRRSCFGYVVYSVFESKWVVGDGVVGVHCALMNELLSKVLIDQGTWACKKIIVGAIICETTIRKLLSIRNMA